MQAILATILIVAGAVVMIASIVKARTLARVGHLLSQRSRGPITRAVAIHRVLMIVFVLGYLVVAGALLLDFYPLGQIAVGVIFFLGSAFVLMGVWIQARMLSEIQSTVYGIVPICAKCKRIRSRDTEAEDRNAWKPITQYIEEDTTADFAQGYCPVCLDQLYGLGERQDQAG